MNLPECFDDLLSAAPRSPGERARRWAAVRRAVGTVSPHLLAAGLASLKARDLRIAFLAIDLHFFHAAYRALFEDGRDVGFAWSIAEEDCGGDAMVKEHSSPLGTVLEFVIDEGRITKLVAEDLARASTFDGMTAVDALDLVLVILARCMLRAAAIVGASSPLAVDRLRDALLRRLLPLEAATAR